MKISSNILYRRVAVKTQMPGSVTIWQVNTKLGDFFKLIEAPTYYQCVNKIWYCRSFEPKISYVKCGIALSIILNKFYYGE